MILQIDDWKFDIDMARTMEYSSKEAADHCDCAYCRNFYAGVDKKFPDLRPFLAQFGIDIEAPDEMLPMIGDELLYDPTYKVFGSILQTGRYELQAGICNFVARTENPEADYFLLDCYEVCLPWILDEPLEGVLSPANEPSVLKKMWQKFLGKASDNGTIS